MIGPQPICLTCKHFNRENFEGLTCTAFKDGIPDVIIMGENKHKKPLPKQGNNIVFEPLERTPANVIQMPQLSTMDADSIRAALKAAIRMGVE